MAPASTLRRFGQRSILIIIISAFLFLIYYWLVSEQTQIENKRKSGIGCPVIFTDKPEFEGAYRCFDIGEIDDLKLQGTGISADPNRHRNVPFSFDANGAVISYGVRIGYHLMAFSEPDFKGDIIINKRGPFEKTFTEASAEPSSFACKNQRIQSGKCLRKTAKHIAPIPRSIKVALAR